MAELEQEAKSFWDHLEALRWTLFRSFLALFIFAIGSFAFMRGSDGIFDRVVLAPCYSDFIFYRWLCDLIQKYQSYILLEPLHQITFLNNVMMTGRK